MMRNRSAGEGEELLEEIAHGSERALSRLYDRYSRILYSLILAILKDPRDAEEVLQEVFLQVWRLARRYDSRRGNVYRWLVNLARSRSIDRTRSKNFARHRETQEILDLLDARSDPSQASQLDVVLMLERADAVREVLARIPPEQRRVMELAYYRGHTQSEIAHRLEIPLGTVKSRMRQGLIALRQVAAEDLRP